MEVLGLEDQTVCQDQKVTEVWMVYLVLLVWLDSVYLEVLDLKEDKAHLVSSDSQGSGV